MYTRNDMRLFLYGVVTYMCLLVYIVDLYACIYAHVFVSLCVHCFLLFEALMKKLIVKWVPPCLKYCFIIFIFFIIILYIHIVTIRYVLYMKVHIHRCDIVTPLSSHNTTSAAAIDSLLTNIERFCITLNITPTREMIRVTRLLFE